jgi:hypothetical protein
MTPTLWGREPALWIATIAALLGIGVTLGLDGLSAEQAAAIVALLSALAAIWTAWLVRPVAPALFTGAVTAAAVLLAAYGLEVSQQTVGAVNLAVIALLTFLTRGQVSPAHDVDPAVLGKHRG